MIVHNKSTCATRLHIYFVMLKIVKIMSIELKHLSFYLPHKVKIKNKNGIKNLTTQTIESVYYDLSSKLILHPLSDLTKEIEINGEKFIPIEKLKIIFGDYVSIDLIKKISKYYIFFEVKHLPFELVLKLIEWHFDVFGLIIEGGAIDINNEKN